MPYLRQGLPLRPVFRRCLLILMIRRRIMVNPLRPTGGLVADQTIQNTWRYLNYYRNKKNNQIKFYRRLYLFNYFRIHGSRMDLRSAIPHPWHLCISRSKIRILRTAVDLRSFVLLWIYYLDLWCQNRSKIRDPWC